jgi:hypothetical protein
MLLLCVKGPVRQEKKRETEREKTKKKRGGRKDGNLYRLEKGRFYV